jgi:hypothetical protein
MRVSLRAAALSLLAIPTLAAKDVLTTGPVVAESISSPIKGYLDAPKLTPVTANDTSYDWYV